MRLRAVFLDLDGTMVEQATTTRFLLHVCAKLGVSATAAQVAQVQRRVGSSWIEDTADVRLQTRDGFVELNAAFLAALGVETDVDRLARRMLDIWDRYPDELDERIYPDVKRGLEALRGKGLALGVVSHRHRELSLASLRRHQLSDDFAGVVSPQIAGTPRGKLDPHLWEYALAMLGVDRDEVVHVDNEYEVGVRGAQQAGIRAVLIDRTGTASPIRGCEVVSDFDDLVQLIGS